MFDALPNKKALLQAAALLAVVELVGFGVYARQIGFYHDDWVYQEIFRGQAGYWAQVKGVAETNLGVRTFASVIYPFFYVIAGAKPFLYQVALMLHDAVAAFLLYAVLARLLGRPRLAMLAAVLSILHPSHPSTHHWFAIQMQPLAQAMILGGLLAHMLWLEGRGAFWLRVSLGTYFLSLICYESVAFLPLLLGAGMLGRAVQAGRGWKAAALEAGRALWPFVPAFLAGVAWQMAFPLFAGGSHPKATVFSLVNVFSVFRAGWACLTFDLVEFCRMAVAGFRFFGDGQAILWGLFTAGCAAVLASAPEERRAPALWPALWIAGAVFLASYAPYAVSNYEPQIHGVMSRINGSGSLAGALILAALLEALTDHPWWRVSASRLRGAAWARGALAALLIGSFTWTDWFVSKQWAEAWTVQRRILAGAAQLSSQLPPDALVLLKGVPEHFNGGPLFSATWDFDAALRLETGRKDLHGDVVKDGMNSEKDGVVYRVNGKILRTYEYGKLFMFDYPEGKLYRLAGP